ncbi:hypothetical protein TNCV_4801321 [Trichonephila clavipes]|nr:hypothetical protein TNCV_4801321 [Trichonephila clavipes]
MTVVAATTFKTDPRAVKEFLTLEGCKPLEMFHRMLADCVDACVSKPKVTRWARLTRDCQQETRDLPRLGYAHKVVTE